MIPILFLVGLLAQGVPTRPDESGVVTGTLRTTDGKPAVGIRVAARAVQDAVAEEEGAALAGLGETDAMGRYRLEGVPSGRYTIAAGRVDLPTYYPGTLDLASGKILSIAPGSTTSGIDFTLADISYAVAGTSAQPPGVTIQVRVLILGQGSSTSPRRDGVRVSGRLPDADRRTIYISEIPGIVYSDGTFEVEGIPPGRHVVVSSANDRDPLGAIVIVGNRDMENVQLDPVLLLPREAPLSEAETWLPGTVIPLAGIRGRIVSDATGQPMRGVLNVIGDSLQVAYAVGNDGKFEIPKLLPGSYNLQVSIFDYFTFNQTVLVGETDSTVELRVRRAY